MKHLFRYFLYVLLSFTVISCANTASGCSKGKSCCKTSQKKACSSKDCTKACCKGDQKKACSKDCTKACCKK